MRQASPPPSRRLGVRSQSRVAQRRGEEELIASPPPTELRAAPSCRQGHRAIVLASSEREARWSSTSASLTEPRRAVGVLTVAGKGFRPPQVSRSEEKAVPLCFDRLEWFCHFWDHRRSSGLSLCRLRPCCRRRKRLPIRLLNRHCCLGLIVGLPPNRFGDRRCFGSTVASSVRVAMVIVNVAGS
ncbi:uncharacterized protein DS421_20g690840 [Arachis hypogaea]|nr:uncharacterized protein DS421_20g690840 [Arachis hypogaea]